MDTASTAPTDRHDRGRGARRALAMTLLAVAMLGAACSDDSDDTSPTTNAVPSTAGDTAPDQAATRIVETHFGAVEIPTDPKRVVAASYYTPWQLQALGVAPVGVQDYGQWIDSFTAEQQAFVEGVATIGVFGELNIEAVAAAEPDLIVGDAFEVDEAQYELLSDIAPTVVVSGENRGDWKTMGAQLADATNTSVEFERTRVIYEERLAEIRDEHPELQSLRWGYFTLGDDDGQFSVLYPTGEMGEMLFGALGATPAPGIPPSDDRVRLRLVLDRATQRHPR